MSEKTHGILMTIPDPIDAANPSSSLWKVETLGAGLAGNVILRGAATSALVRSAWRGFLLQRSQYLCAGVGRPTTLVA